MKKTLFTSVFLICCISIFAQNKDLSVVLMYKISAEEALAYRNDDDKPIEYLQEKYLHTYVDSFHSENLYHIKTDTLSGGYYVFVSTHDEDLNMTLMSFNHYHIRLVEREEDLVLQVLDTLKGLQENAKVYFNNRRMKYYPESKTHERPKMRKDGIVKVVVNGQTIFYEIEYDGDETQWERFLENIGYEKWKRKRRNRKFGKQRKRNYALEQEKCKGYIVINQPKYRHGDTVKVKSYIANTKGKPLTKPVVFAVYSSNLSYIDNVYRKTPILQATVEPNLEGNYTFDFVLGDSLDLDKRYYIYVMKPFDSQKRLSYFSQYFYLEDYELTKVKYSFEEAQPQKTYYQNKKDKILFLAAAKNQNGQFITDGVLRLTLLREKVYDISSSSIKIPDTLWQNTIDLSSKRITPILISWDLIPKANMDIDVIAEFYNSNGEYERRKLEIEVFNLANHLSIQLEGSEIVCQYFEDSVSISKPAIFYSYDDDRDIEIKRKVQLPYRTPLNPYFEYFEIETEDDFEEFYLEDYIEEQRNDLDIKVYGSNTGDSIFIYLKNPRKIPIQYSIFQVKKLVKKGGTSEDFWQFKAAHNEVPSFTILYSFPVSGYSMVRNATFSYYGEELNVKITQPDEVIPGATVPIKIKVTNEEGQPQPTTNLTAIALNAALGAGNQYSTSGFKYPKRKNIKGREFFDWDEIYDTKNRSITPYFYQKLELDQDEYYQMRHPKEGIWIKSDTITADKFYERYAQFAPFIVKDGRMQDILMIYCNQDLVFFSGAVSNRPYSFVGHAGKNTIIIRTKTHRYILTDVLLKKGHKLEIVLDADKYQQHPFSKNIQRIKVDDEKFEFQELETLRNTMMILNNSDRSNVYIWQSHAAIHYVPHDYKAVVGPFKRGKSLHYVKFNHFQKALEFKSGYEYDIDPTTNQLTSIDYFNQKPYIRNYKHKSPKTGEFILKPADIKMMSSSDPIDNINAGLIMQEKIDASEGGEYNFEISNIAYEKSIPIKTYWLKDGRIIEYTNAKGSKRLPAGNYSLLIYNKDSTYAVHDFTISKDTLLYEKIDYSQLTFQLDTNLQQLRVLAKALLEFRPIQDVSDFLPASQILDNGTDKVILKGKIIDAINKEGLIAVTIIVTDSSRNVVARVITDFNGDYEVKLDSGVYKIGVSYVGYGSQKTDLLRFSAGKTVKFHFGLEEGHLENISITARGNYSIEYSTDRATSGNAVSNGSVMIRGAVSGITMTTVGATSADDGAAVLIGGAIPQTNVSQILIDPYENDKTIYKPIIDAPYDIISNHAEQDNIRSNFQDYAFWQPNLITDQNGEAYFNATFPDNITKWETRVLGMDRKARLGFGYAQTKSYKPVIGQLSLPRFLIVGDETEIIGKAVNFTDDTFNIQTQFKQGEQILTTKQHQLTNGIVEKTTITADVPMDKFELTYQLIADDFGDGEQRNIPVFQKGVLETAGEFWALNNDTTFQFQANGEMGQVQLSVQANALDVLISDIQQLKVYPYDCNEQIASKLMALLLEQEVNAQLNRPFKGKRAIKRTISKLKKRQNSDGSWSWWNSGDANVMMTVHITKSLAKAVDFQYLSYEDYYSPISKALKYLVDNFYTFSKSEQFQVLELLAQIDKEYDLRDPVKVMDKQATTLYQEMVLLEAKQKAGLKYSLDSLEQYRQQTTFGGSYFGKEGYLWFDNSIPLTVLAYNIYKNAKREDVCESIRQYFLEQRRYNGWRNTYESAQILATILPDILKENGKVSQNTLTINEQQLDISNPNTSFKFGDEVLNIKKTGSTPLFLTAYQSFQNISPKAKNDIFEVKTAFRQKGKKHEKSTVRLAKNTPVNIIATVNVKEAADYVMIEVPIPAGCSYDTKPQSFGNYEVHREYFRNKVAIFCQQLPVGEYSFSIPLQARFAGDYTVNSAKIEQMYFPVFYGRNEGKIVTIKQRK